MRKTNSPSKVGFLFDSARSGHDKCVNTKFDQVVSYKIKLEVLRYVINSESIFSEPPLNFQLTKVLRNNPLKIFTFHLLRLEFTIDTLKAKGK